VLPEVIEDFSDNRSLRDESDDPHRLAASAPERIDLVGAADHRITDDKDLLVVDPAWEPTLPEDLKILTPREYLEKD